MDFSFIKSRYDYELQRREQLFTALTLPVGILTVLGSAIVAMARSFSYRDSSDVGRHTYSCLYSGNSNRRVSSFSNCRRSWPVAKPSALLGQSDIVRCLDIDGGGLCAVPC